MQYSIVLPIIKIRCNCMVMYYITMHCIVLHYCVVMHCVVLCNNSLRLGKLDWKTVNITPVFKKEDKSLIVNYRQISLLSIVSKLCESCVL